MLGVLASYSVTVKELKLLFTLLKGQDNTWVGKLYVVTFQHCAYVLTVTHPNRHEYHNNISITWSVSVQNAAVGFELHFVTSLQMSIVVF